MTDLEQARQFSDMGLEKLEVYKNYLHKIGVEAPSNTMLEVGTRTGGTSILALLQPQISSVISIDPYGAKPYVAPDGNAYTPDYDNAMEMNAQLNCNRIALENGKFYTHYKMTSLDFLKLNFDFWLDGKQTPIKDLKFDFVILDGDHRKEVVLQEIELVKPRVNKGGYIMVDNIDWWDTIEDTEVLEATKDIGFIKL